MTDFPAVVYIKGSHSFGAAEGGKSKRMKDVEMEPVKKFKSSKLPADETDQESLKDLLMNFNKEMFKKLDNIERQVDFLSESYDLLEQKVESLSTAVSEQNETLRATVANRENLLSEDSGTAVPVSSKVIFITLNREEDFPNGSWLGDPDNNKCRVRCHISPTELFHIDTTCTSAEKMALTLLDYLFDRETQACSNISGMGKHKKKQLDPLFIYGMKCHLNFHFNITDHDWSRIKQNVDSKCRTAFRRKIKGLSLNPKVGQLNFSNQLETGSEVLNFNSVSPNSIITNGLTELHDENLEFQVINSETEANILARAIKEEKGDFQILHATPEEVAEIQQTHSIQLLYSGSNLVLPSKVSDSSFEHN